MNDYRAGDVLVSHTGGRNRYVRLCDYTGDDPLAHWVQDCDGAGFLLNGTVRPLRTQTLNSRYRLHHRPENR